MIPEFPQFKNLELSDKDEIEAITSKYPPYSDFNFTSMWSWDIENELQISKLNNNLIVKFRDYITREPFYSLIGINNINDSVDKLLSLSKKEGLIPRLKLVPNEVVENLDKNKFKIKEDKDHFDYILKINSIVSHRKEAVRHFKNEFNTHSILIDSKNDIEFNSISIFLKKLFEIDSDLKNEIQAIERLKLINNKNIIILAILYKNKVIGFVINELLDNNYAMGHFLKADKSFSKLIFSYVMNESASSLVNLKCNQINIQQDLGIEGLRKWKESYQPCLYFKKYIVEYNHE